MMMKHAMTTRIQTVVRLACVLTPLSGPVVLAADIPAPPMPSSSPGSLTLPSVTARSKNGAKAVA